MLSSVLFVEAKSDPNVDASYGLCLFMNILSATCYKKQYDSLRLSCLGVYIMVYTNKILSQIKFTLGYGLLSGVSSMLSL